MAALPAEGGGVNACPEGQPIFKTGAGTIPAAPSEKLTHRLEGAFRPTSATR